MAMSIYFAILIKLMAIIADQFALLFFDLFSPFASWKISTQFHTKFLDSSGNCSRRQQNNRNARRTIAVHREPLHILHMYKHECFRLTSI